MKIRSTSVAKNLKINSLRFSKFFFPGRLKPESSHFFKTSGLNIHNLYYIVIEIYIYIKASMSKLDVQKVKSFKAAVVLIPVLLTA
jgi:hypothetical protein